MTVCHKQLLLYVGFSQFFNKSPVLLYFFCFAQMSYCDTLRSRMNTALADVKSKPGQALKTVLQELPVREKKVGEKPSDKAARKEFEKQVQEARDVACECVCTVFCSIESAKIPSAVKELTDDERDTLMKFIYRGFTERTTVDGKPKAKYDCNLLLKGHEEISKVNGTGPIIRTIHTRLEV